METWKILTCCHFKRNQSFPENLNLVHKITMMARRNIEKYSEEMRSGTATESERSLRRIILVYYKNVKSDRYL